jgi:hypothetical protein
MKSISPFHHLIATSIFCLILLDSESFAQSISSTQTTADIEPLRPITVQPFCANSPEKIMVHVVIESKYEYSKVAKGLEKEQLQKTRNLWQFSCSVMASQCEALNINLDNIDHGNPLNFFDASVLVGMKIVRRTKNLIVVEWGPLRTFIVDFAKNRVEYRESSTDSEGYGVGACSM